MDASEFEIFHRDALNEVMSLLGESISYKGSNISAVVNQIEFEEELRDGGFFKQKGAIAVCHIDCFANTPSAGEIVLYQSRRFRIDKVETDLSSVTLYLVSDTK